jgi:shikimate kinase
MGSGKSSVGKVLARKLACNFVDLDSEIESVADCSINSIFARDGEAAFRALESEQLERILQDRSMAVIATGGGAVIAEQNRNRMRNGGVVINLKVTLEQVLSRLQGCQNRPLLAGEKAPESVKALMEAREYFYSDADIQIDTGGKSVEDVAMEILRCLNRLSA